MRAFASVRSVMISAAGIPWSTPLMPERILVEIEQRAAVGTHAINAPARILADRGIAVELFLLTIAKVTER